MLWNVLRTLLCGVEDDDNNIISLYLPEPTRRVTASPLDFACQSLALSGIRKGRKSEMVWNDWEFGMWDYPGWKKQEQVYGEDSDPRYKGRQTDVCTLLKGSSLRIMDSRSMTRVPAVRSSPVFGVFAKTKDRTGGLVWRECKTGTGPPKDQDHSPVRSWTAVFGSIMCFRAVMAYCIH
jgi:hypothetical protein